MPLLDNALTTDQKKDKTLFELQHHMLNGAKEQYYRMQAGWNYVWNNPYGLTPQEVADAFGAKALSLFQLQAKAKELVDAIDPAIWQLGARPGTVTPVLDVDGNPTGYVLITVP